MKPPEAKPLPADIARCEGRAHDSPGGLVFADECLDCRRRTSPPQGYRLPWMTPSDEVPCPWRIEPA